MINNSSKKAMKVYLYQEALNNNQVPMWEKLIKKDVNKAWTEMSIARIATPGFIKYFEDTNWKQTTFNDWDKLYTIEDPKFKLLSESGKCKDYKCVELIREVYRLSNNENFLRYAILNTIMVNFECNIPPQILRSIYKIRSLHVKHEMEHEVFPNDLYDLGNIHLFKDGSKYIIINGNHRVLGFMHYSVNVNHDFRPIKVWVGEKNNGKDKKNLK